MERYSKYSTEQLQGLAERSDRVYRGISNPNYVEDRKTLIPPSHPRWGEKLNLQGLSGEDRLLRLRRTIIPIQKRLQKNIGEIEQEIKVKVGTKALNSIIDNPETKPEQITEGFEFLLSIIDVVIHREKDGTNNPEQTELLQKMIILNGDEENFDLFKEDLRRWFADSAPSNEKSARQVTPRGSLNIISLEQVRLANQIIQAMEDSQVKAWMINLSLTPEEFKKQALAFSEFVQANKEGKVEPIAFPEIINATREQKSELAEDKVRQLLAQLIIFNQGTDFESTKYRWGRQMRELIDYLGSNGEQTLGVAIDNLAEVEKALFFKASSMTLLRDLGYIDLDECSEDRFASYLVSATFIKNTHDRDDTLEMIVDAAIERDEEGSLDLQALMGLILQIDYQEVIFKRLLESAKFRRFRTNLMILFTSHKDTNKLVRNAEESMYSDAAYDEGNILPSHRLAYGENQRRDYGRTR